MTDPFFVYLHQHDYLFEVNPTTKMFFDLGLASDNKLEDLLKGGSLEPYCVSSLVDETVERNLRIPRQLTYNEGVNPDVRS